MSSSEGDETIEPHILDSYEIVELLGKGAYGVVWKVVDKKTGIDVALKKIFKAFQNATDSQRTYREVHLLRQLKHEHIIKLNRIIKAENGEDLYLVFDYMDSDLHYAIRTGILEEEHKRYLVYQMLKGLLYIHSANVIHRDIKPENMLINTACELKIADFGLSRSLEEDMDGENAPMTDYVATRWYRSPEILFGSSSYTKGVDLWAIGCIVAELYGEKPIFPGKSTIDQLARIIEVTGRPTEEELEAASLGSKYTQKMMSSIPRVIHRSLAAIYPSCDEDAIDFMECCFKFNPNERITVEEALRHPYLENFREVDEEILCQEKIRIPISDNIRKQMDVYRDALYELCDNWEGSAPGELDEIVEKKVEQRRRRRKKRDGEHRSKRSSSKKKRDSSSSKRDSSKKKRDSSKKDSSKRDSSKKDSSKRDSTKKDPSKRDSSKPKRSSSKKDLAKPKRSSSKQDLSSKKDSSLSSSKKKKRSTSKESSKKKSISSTGEKKKRKKTD